MATSSKRSHLKERYARINHAHCGECLNRRLRLVYSRRYQLKIQQMAFMLMAVFVFFILAGLFYIMSQSHDLKVRAEMIQRNRAIELANNLVESAEFSCGPYCIDADRAMVLSKMVGYKSLWKASSMRIRSGSSGDKDIPCTESTYPDCNLITVYDSGKPETTVYSYVSVCQRSKDNEYVEYKCKIGKFIVGYETK